MNNELPTRGYKMWVNQEEWLILNMHGITDDTPQERIEIRSERVAWWFSDEASPSITEHTADCVLPVVWRVVYVWEQERDFILARRQRRGGPHGPQAAAAKA